VIVVTLVWQLSASDAFGDDRVRFHRDVLPILAENCLSCESTHDADELLFHCGTPLFGNPSFGAWVNYGLGSESRNLPGYLVLISDEGHVLEGAGSALWGSGFMPSMYRGITFRHAGRDYRLTDVAGNVVREILS